MATATGAATGTTLNDAYRRLLETGRRQGVVTLEQIKQFLPVRSMTEAQIGEAIERLERDGVAVELDEDLAMRRRTPEDEAGAAVDLRRSTPEEQRAAGVARVHVPEPLPGTGAIGMSEIQPHPHHRASAFAAEDETRKVFLITAIILALMLLVTLMLLGG